jgi:hypothetical protein
MYRKLIGMPLVGLAAFALWAPAQQREQAPEREVERGRPAHPHMVAALHELREARTELKESRDDFGGRKERALRDIDAAIEQLRGLVERERR